MLDFLRVIVFDEGGATAVEYGLVAALVSIAGMAALTSAGSSLASIYDYITELSANASS